MSTEREIYEKWHLKISWSNSIRYRQLKDLIHEAYEAGEAQTAQAIFSELDNITVGYPQGFEKQLWEIDEYEKIKQKYLKGNFRKVSSKPEGEIEKNPKAST